MMIEHYDLSYIEILTQDTIKFNNDLIPFARLFNNHISIPISIHNTNEPVKFQTIYAMVNKELENNKLLLALIIKNAGIPKKNNSSYHVHFPVNITLGNIIEITINMTSVNMTQDISGLLFNEDNAQEYLKTLSSDINSEEVRYTTLEINNIFYRLSYYYLWYCTTNLLLEKEFEVINMLELINNNDSPTFLLSNLVQIINNTYIDFDMYDDINNVIYIDTCQSNSNGGSDCEVRTCIIKAAGLHEKYETTVMSKEDVVAEIKQQKDLHFLFTENFKKEDFQTFTDDDIFLLNFIKNYTNLTFDLSPVTKKLMACVNHIINIPKTLRHAIHDKNCLVINAKHVMDELRLAHDKAISDLD
jgi:hypothetical protein